MSAPKLEQETPIAATADDGQCIQDESLSLLQRLKQSSQDAISRNKIPWFLACLISTLHIVQLVMSSQHGFGWHRCASLAQIEQQCNHATEMLAHANDHDTDCGIELFIESLLLLSLNDNHNPNDSNDAAACQHLITMNQAMRRLVLCAFAILSVAALVLVISNTIGNSPHHRKEQMLRDALLCMIVTLHGSIHQRWMRKSTEEQPFLNKTGVEPPMVLSCAILCALLTYATIRQSRPGWQLTKEGKRAIAASISVAFLGYMLCGHTTESYLCFILVANLICVPSIVMTSRSEYAECTGWTQFAASALGWIGWKFCNSAWLSTNAMDARCAAVQSVGWYITSFFMAYINLFFLGHPSLSMPSPSSGNSQKGLIFQDRQAASENASTPDDGSLESKDDGAGDEADDDDEWDAFSLSTLKGRPAK